MSAAEYTDLAAAHGHTFAAWEQTDRAIRQWQREHPVDDRDALDLIHASDFQAWLNGTELPVSQIGEDQDDDFGEGILDDE